MEAFNFTAASEDSNLYTYDMRKLTSAACVHKARARAAGRGRAASRWERVLRRGGVRGGGGSTRAVPRTLHARIDTQCM